MVVRVLPDAERIVVDYLRSHPDAVALVATRVTTVLPPEPVFPAVTVARVGGVPSIPAFLDAPRVEIAVWADRYKQSQARLVAATVEAAMLAIPGVHDLGTITSIVEEGLGPRWSPDVPTGRARYLMNFEFYVHP